MWVVTLWAEGGRTAGGHTAGSSRSSKPMDIYTCPHWLYRRCSPCGTIKGSSFVTLFLCLGMIDGYQRCADCRILGTHPTHVRCFASAIMSLSPRILNFCMYKNISDMRSVCVQVCVGASLMITSLTRSL